MCVLKSARCESARMHDVIMHMPRVSAVVVAQVSTGFRAEIAATQKIPASKVLTYTQVGRQRTCRKCNCMNMPEAFAASVNHTSLDCRPGLCRKTAHGLLLCF